MGTVILKEIDASVAMQSASPCIPFSPRLRRLDVGLEWQQVVIQSTHLVQPPARDQRRDLPGCPLARARGRRRLANARVGRQEQPARVASVDFVNLKPIARSRV
jgi:hypothetical protein